MQNLHSLKLKSSEKITDILETKRKIEVPVYSEIEITIIQNFINIMQKNHGLETMTKISRILTGDNKSMDGLPEELTETT